jgi:hypothetical protein
MSIAEKPPTLDKCRPEAVVRAWYETVWNAFDTDAVARLFRPDGGATGLVDGEATASDLVVMVQATHALVDRLDVRLVHLMTDDTGWVSVVTRLTGIGRRNGADVDCLMQMTCQVRDGVIVRAYNAGDTLGLCLQLDLMPPDAMIHLLQGKRLEIAD